MQRLYRVCTCFKWVRILPEIDWYHYQCASLASKIEKDPYEVKCHIRAQCAPPPDGIIQTGLHNMFTLPMTVGPESCLGELCLFVKFQTYSTIPSKKM